MLCYAVRFFYGVLNAWERLGAPGSARERQGPPGSARERQGAPGNARERQGAPGSAWESLGAPGNARELAPPGLGSSVLGAVGNHMIIETLQFSCSIFFGVLSAPESNPGGAQEASKTPQNPLKIHTYVENLEYPKNLENV